MAKHCGAKTRAGGRCKAPAMANGRCRVHGGSSTGPDKPNTANNAATHGIYQKHLTQEERGNYSALTLGEVDHELRLMRIRLARALEAEFLANGDPELDEITDNGSGGATFAAQSKRLKVRDYNTIIDRITARIESLEKTRKLLDGGDGANGDIGAFETKPYDEA